MISQPFGQFGGVVQYDFGKTGTEGHFTRTGSLNALPTILLTALSKLQSNYRQPSVDSTWVTASLTTTHTLVPSPQRNSFTAHALSTQLNTQGIKHRNIHSTAITNNKCYLERTTSCTISRSGYTSKGIAQSTFSITGFVFPLLCWLGCCTSWPGCLDIYDCADCLFEGWQVIFWLRLLCDYRGRCVVWRLIFWSGLLRDCLHLSLC